MVNAVSAGTAPAAAQARQPKNARVPVAATVHGAERRAQRDRCVEAIGVLGLNAQSPSERCNGDCALRLATFNPFASNVRPYTSITSWTVASTGVVIGHPLRLHASAAAAPGTGLR